MKKNAASPIARVSKGPRLDRRDFLSLSLKVMAACGVAGLAPRPPIARAQGDMPNIIYVVIDTTRADHMSFLGYERNTTPNLSALAAQASVFSRSISPANWTLPSFASYLSGKTPLSHNFNSPHDNTRLSGTLANILANQAYQTVSIQTNLFLPRLDGDFQDRYHLHDAAPETMDGIAVDQAIQWLGDNREKARFFMFMGLFSPHQKYFPHDSITGYLQDDSFQFGSTQLVQTSPNQMATDFLLEYDDMPYKAQAILGKPQGGGYYQEARIYTASYDSEINYADEQLGLLFESLKSAGLYDSSIIVVTADHGEMMDRGSAYFSHGQDMSIGQIHVPLMIKLPNQSQGQLINQWVSTMDVAPTLLDYLRLDLAGQEGVSLLPLVNGSGSGWSHGDIVAYAEDYSPETTGSPQSMKSLFALVLEGYKFTKMVSSDKSGQQDPVYALHNLEVDPSEQDDLSLVRADLLDQLKVYVEQRYPKASYR